MLEDPSHGRWYCWIKIADGLRKRMRRGGFASEEAAIAARDAAITEPSPRVLAQAWTVEKWLTDWLEQMDLPPVRLHDLRHEAASLMGAAGVQPHVIQKVLGHSSAVTTVDTYWQANQDVGAGQSEIIACE